MKYTINTSALIDVVLKFYKENPNFINGLIEESIFPDLIFYEIGSYLRKYKEIKKVSNNEIKEITELFNYIIGKAKIEGKIKL
ncbi:MAG: hypothetical protein ACO2ON_03455 [Candidatus Nanopusillus sp.]